MDWRRLLRVLHRDIGYFAFGLTAIYAVSGFVVNHRHDWDLDRVREEHRVQVGLPHELLPALPADRVDALRADPGSFTPEEERQLTLLLTSKIGRTAPPKNAFWRGRDRFSLFFETGERDTANYFPSTGEVQFVAVRDRPFFRDVNFLHLNEPRRAWTYIADLFAIALFFLAISGIVMVRGRGGLWGRGGLFVLLGLALPVAALLAFRYL